MPFQLPHLRTLLSFALILHFTELAKGISVSGRITESDAGPVRGITIRVEQIGGELAPFTTQTGDDGRWSITDSLLTGNLRVTPSSASFTFSPASRDSFTFDNVSGQDFTATPTVPRANITVTTGARVLIPNGGSLTFPGVALGASTLAAVDIRNDGTLTLSNISMTVTGAQGGLFSVATAPKKELAPDQLSLGTVRIIPTEAGVASATILIHSDDPNENPYVVQVSGQVVSLEVTNTADSGPGSLRQALLNTVITEDDDRIRFHPSLSGKTIVLSNEIPIFAIAGVFIDASSLPGGLILSGNHTTRILSIGVNRTALKGLTFINGRSVSPEVPVTGGAIDSAGSLYVSDCVFSNNVSGGQGGAIFSSGTSSVLTLSNCTFIGNSSRTAGAVFCARPTTISGCAFLSNSANTAGAVQLRERSIVSRCTLTGNRAVAGGAIAHTEVVLLEHCTISGNAADRGGGVFTAPTSFLFCDFSIVAGNTAGLTPNISDFRIETASITEGDPLLAPLDNYGGPTKTMALLPGSPARNAATNSTSTSDQRGFPIVGVPDIGAYEAGTFSNFNAFVWEKLPATASAAQHDGAIDFDVDGADNFAEWLASTDPADALSTFRILRIAPAILNAQSAVEVTFTSSRDRHYSIETSSNFTEWVSEPGSVPGTGNSLTVPIGPLTAPSPRFIRVRAGP